MILFHIKRDFLQSFPCFSSMAEHNSNSFSEVENSAVTRGCDSVFPSQRGLLFANEPAERRREAGEAAAL